MNLKTLAQAREAVAGLEARIVELEALQAKAELADAAALALTEAQAAFEVERASFNDHLKQISEAKALLELSLETEKAAVAESKARISELEASAQSAEARAREILGNAGGKPLAVDSAELETRSISELANEVNEAAKSKDQARLASAYAAFSKARKQK